MGVVVDLRGERLLWLADFGAEEIGYLIELAAELKAAEEGGGGSRSWLAGRSRCCSRRDSTRVRCGFGVAAFDRGAYVTFVGWSGSRMGREETVRDTARVLGRV
jgi:ornithine carbamoyltransferase